MENISPGKERRNPLAILALLGVFVGVILLLPAPEERFYKDGLPTEVGRGEIVEKKIILLFVGDIMLSRAVGDIMEKSGNWEYPFLLTADFLKSADLTFGNLEGPISSGGTKVGSIYSFRANPKVVEGLLYAGFDVLSIANNHIWDYGRDALIDTIQILGSADIAYVGGGLNYKEAHTPVVKDVEGVKIAYLAYTNLIPPTSGAEGAASAVAFFDLDVAVSDVRAARAASDVVIVSLHWGDEYKSVPDERQRTAGRALVDAGASLIVGHHPHVIQEVEEYRDGFIAYSLGNFVFDQNFSEETMEGLMIRVIIQNGKIEKLEPIKIKIGSSFQPFILNLSQ